MSHRHGCQLAVPGASVQVDNIAPTDALDKPTKLPLKGRELVDFFQSTVSDFVALWDARTSQTGGDVDAVHGSRADGIAAWLTCRVFELVTTLTATPELAATFLEAGPVRFLTKLATQPAEDVPSHEGPFPNLPGSAAGLNRLAHVLEDVRARKLGVV